MLCRALEACRQRYSEDETDPGEHRAWGMLMVSSESEEEALQSLMIPSIVLEQGLYVMTHGGKGSMLMNGSLSLTIKPPLQWGYTGVYLLSTYPPLGLN